VSQEGRREEIKEKKKEKGRGLMAKKMGCTRLGQAGDLGRVRKSGLGREEWDA
jgi:hypothetical protein